MKTDSKIAIGISSVLVAIGLFLFIWMLPLIFTWLAFSSPHTKVEIPHLRKAVSCSIFNWQKIYTIESILPALSVVEQHEEVIKYYEKMEKDNIETNVSKFFAANAYAKMGNYEKALHLAKETSNLWQLAKFYIATDDLNNAKKTVDKIRSTKKNSPNINLFIAQIQLKEGMIKDANTTINKLLRVNPQHTEALEVKIEILQKLGNVTEAKNYAQKLDKVKESRKRIRE